MRDSKEFGLEMFDALSRRRRLKVDKISREELYEFWSQITDQSFDSRLQIFFDMYVSLFHFNRFASVPSRPVDNKFTVSSLSLERCLLFRD